jgi:hypothetical protein
MKSGTYHCYTPLTLFHSSPYVIECLPVVWKVSIVTKRQQMVKWKKKSQLVMHVTRWIIDNRHRLEKWKVSSSKDE